MIRPLLRLVLGIAMGTAASLAIADGAPLRIHGSNTLGAKLMPELVKAWMASDGYARTEQSTPRPNEMLLRGERDGATRRVELQAHGSGSGIEDLLAGRADLAMASRPVSAEELRRGVALGALDSPEQEAVVALDGVAVIVHRDHPLRELSLPQLRDVFTGRIRDWSALGAAPGPIVLDARDAQSGTWETFRTLVLGEAALRADARRYESSAELAAAVAADMRAIGFVGLAAIGEARALALRDGGHALVPDAASVAVEDYVLSRRLFLYRANDATPTARAFVEFALSPAGQRVVERHGFVAQQVRPYRAPSDRDAPADYTALVGDAQRLSVNFRFGAGSRLLDGKLLRDVDRLADFMRSPAQRGSTLRLAGFADASEVSPYLALTLSNDRVDLISRLLEARSVAVHRGRGFGGARPLSDDEDAHGRLRNRRVEVWLGPATTPGVASARAAAAR